MWNRPLRIASAGFPFNAAIIAGDDIFCRARANNRDTYANPMENEAIAPNGRI